MRETYVYMNSKVILDRIQNLLVSEDILLGDHVLQMEGHVSNLLC